MKAEQSKAKQRAIAPSTPPNTKKGINDESSHSIFAPSVRFCFRFRFHFLRHKSLFGFCGLFLFVDNYSPWMVLFAVHDVHQPLVFVRFMRAGGLEWVGCGGGGLRI